MGGNFTIDYNYNPVTNIQIFQENPPSDNDINTYQSQYQRGSQKYDSADRMGNYQQISPAYDQYQMKINDNF